MVWMLTDSSLFAPALGDYPGTIEYLAWVGYIVAYGTLGAPGPDIQAVQDALRHTVMDACKLVHKWAGFLR